MNPFVAGILLGALVTVVKITKTQVDIYLTHKKLDKE